MNRQALKRKRKTMNVQDSKRKRKRQIGRFLKERGRPRTCRSEKERRSDE